MISKLKNLRYINLSINKISKFPTEITDVENLQGLDLENNYINFIPKELSKLKSLNELYLGSSNPISLRYIDFFEKNKKDNSDYFHLKQMLPKCEIYLSIRPI